MKTFDEALGLFYREVPNPNPGQPPSQELMEEVGGEMEDGVARRKQIMDEIMENAAAQRFIIGFKQAVGHQCNYSVVAFAIHVLAHGVAIGMEMNKEELSEDLLKL